MIYYCKKQSHPVLYYKLIKPLSGEYMKLGGEIKDWEVGSVSWIHLHEKEAEEDLKELHFENNRYYHNFDASCWKQLTKDELTEYLKSGSLTNLKVNKFAIGDLVKIASHSDYFHRQGRENNGHRDDRCSQVYGKVITYTTYGVLSVKIEWNDGRRTINTYRESDLDLYQDEFQLEKFAPQVKDSKDPHKFEKGDLVLISPRSQYYETQGRRDNGDRLLGQKQVPGIVTRVEYSNNPDSLCCKVEWRYGKKSRSSNSYRHSDLIPYTGIIIDDTPVITQDMKCTYDIGDSVMFVDDCLISDRMAEATSIHSEYVWSHKLRLGSVYVGTEYQNQGAKVVDIENDLYLVSHTDVNGVLVILAYEEKHLRRRTLDDVREALETKSQLGHTPAEMHEDSGISEFIDDLKSIVNDHIIHQASFEIGSFPMLSENAFKPSIKKSDRVEAETIKIKRRN